jgi:glucokinase
MRIKRKEPIALGFDIGGSTTKVGLVSQSGKLLAIEKTPTDVEITGLDKFLEKFLALLQAMLAQAGRPVLGIGGTFLGWIDEARSGPYLCINAPTLHGLNLSRILEQHFRLPVQLIDDSNAHALAEYSFGAGQGCRRFMNLAMGTGLSAAVILYGQPLQFTCGCAGDTGHVILRPGGPSCSAGCKGCAEALIGVAGIERLALEKYGASVSARQVIELARAGSDPLATAVMAEIGGYVGELLASLSHIFLPERISLSGGTANAGETLLKAVQERFEYLVGDYHRLYASRAGGYYDGVEIVLGKLKEETGLIGATVGLFREPLNH